MNTPNWTLSNKLNGVAESATLKMGALTKELTQKGIKVFNLTAGEPDMPVPANVKTKAIEAIEKDFNKYTLVNGTLELRTALSQKLKRDNGVDYTPEQIIDSTGGKQCIALCFDALLNQGDEVLIVAPYWVSYPEMVKLSGATATIITTTAANEYKLTPTILKQTLTNKTRMLILNSPSNPSGVTYSRAELAALAQVLEGTSVLVLSDEIYEKLTFDLPFTSFASVSADAFSRTITINGFSKAYSMTGWRLGYAAAPTSVIKAMSLLQSQTTSNPNSVAQFAALEALNVKEDVLDERRQIFRRRRELVCSIFDRAPEFSYIKPTGAFYLFVDIGAFLGRHSQSYNQGKPIATSDELSLYLLSEAHVGTVAGTSFGAPNFIRLSFATSDAVIEEGANRIVQFLNILVK